MTKSDGEVRPQPDTTWRWEDMLRRARKEENMGAQSLCCRCKRAKADCCKALITRCRVLIVLGKRKWKSVVHLPNCDAGSSCGDLDSVEGVLARCWSRKLKWAEAEGRTISNRWWSWGERRAVQRKRDLPPRSVHGRELACNWWKDRKVEG